MSTRTLLLLTSLAGLAFVAPAAAQRGMGDPQGVARGGEVERASVTGTLVETVVTECPATTGRAPTGVHLVVDRGAGEAVAELHLGPVEAVADILDAAAPGAPAAAEAFRTDAMPADTFVAIRLTLDGTAFRLRDDATLRPDWAASRGPFRRDGLGGAGRADLTARPAPARGGCWWDVQPAP